MNENVVFEFFGPKQDLVLGSERKNNNAITNILTAGKWQVLHIQQQVGRYRYY